MGNNPHEPELRRSEKGATVQEAAESKAREEGTDAPGQPHGADRGGKGGGRGGGVPPEQQPEHP